jgi:hypothetical protein
VLLTRSHPPTTTTAHESFLIIKLPKCLFGFRFSFPPRVTEAAFPSQTPLAQHHSCIEYLLPPHRWVLRGFEDGISMETWPSSPSSTGKPLEIWSSDCPGPGGAL